MALHQWSSQDSKFKRTYLQPIITKTYTRSSCRFSSIKYSVRQFSYFQYTNRGRGSPLSNLLKTKSRETLYSICQITQKLVWYQWQYVTEYGPIDIFHCCDKCRLCSRALHDILTLADVLARAIFSSHNNLKAVHTTHIAPLVRTHAILPLTPKGLPVYLISVRMPQSSTKWQVHYAGDIR